MEHSPASASQQSATTARTPWWKRLFTRTPTNSQQPEPAKEAPRTSGSKTEPDNDAPTNHLIFIQTLEHPDTNLHAGLTRSLENLNDGFYRMGYDEGKYGKETTNQWVEAIAQSRVGYIRNELQIECNQQIKACETRLQTITEEIEDLTTDKGTHDDYLHRLREQYRLYSRDFSRRLGNLYLLIGGLLVAADIPLAVELTQRGFGLATSDDYPIKDLFTTNFPYVVGNNWEVFIMAFGVALCTIYIKMFWDEFLETPVANTVLKYKNLKGIETDEEKELVNRRKNGRLAVKVTVLVLTITMITILGIFRARTMQREVDTELIEITAAAEANKMNPDDLAKMRDAKEVRTIDIVTFVALTLAFPIIGGICISKGISCIHNRRELKKAEQKSVDLKDEISGKKRTELSKAKSDLQKMLEMKEFLDGKEFETTYPQDASGAYLRGFARGLGDSLHQTGNDYFDLAREFRSKLARRKIFESLASIPHGNGDDPDPSGGPGPDDTPTVILPNSPVSPPVIPQARSEQEATDLDNPS